LHESFANIVAKLFVVFEIARSP